MKYRPTDFHGDRCDCQGQATALGLLFNPILQLSAACQEWSEVRKATVKIIGSVTGSSTFGQILEQDDMLTGAQIEAYHENGYVVPDYRLPETVLEQIRADHDRLLALYPDFRDNCSALLSHDLGFLNYARNAKILDMVAQLIGEDICLWNMSFFAKPALNGKKTPFHQDGEYWPIRPLATCTVWIAVDEATVENGCLRYIPGSHKANRLMAHEVNNDPNYTLNRELMKDEYDESQAENLILPAGGMAFHDVYIAHGSEENCSPYPRRGMTLRLIPTSSIYDRELACRRHAERGGLDMSHHSIFLMRGRDVSGRNDFRVRFGAR